MDGPLAIMLKNFYYQWKSLNDTRSRKKSTLILVSIDHNSVFAFYVSTEVLTDTIIVITSK